MKKLSKKSLNKCYWNWAFFHLSSMNFAKFQTYGLLHSLMPAFKELYQDNKDEEVKAFRRHMNMFNVEPCFGSVVPGIMVGLEEAKANGADVSDEMINEIKVGLMGPMAGIGDTITGSFQNPVLLGIGISLAAGGSMMGPLFLIVATFIYQIGISRFLFYKGYTLGISSMDLLLGKGADRFKRAMNLMGLVAVGAIAAAYCNIVLDIQFLGVNTQEMLDSIFPKLLEFGLIFVFWYLQKRKNVKPTTLIISVIVLSVAGVLLHAF